MDASAAGGSASEAGLPELAACVQQPPAMRWAQPTVVASLPSLCAALAAAGLPSCPADRAAYLRSLDQECQPGRTFPQFDRRCSVDHITLWSESWMLTWYFGAATGELVGARLMDREQRLPCGATLYRGGVELPKCHTSEGACSLCVAEPDECPADISAAIATTPCAAPVDAAAACTCDEGAPGGLSLPESGTACGTADQCARCQNGTCWSDCRCMRSGMRRYLTMCTD